MAQLRERSYKNQLQQSTYLCYNRNRTQIMAGEQTLAEPRLKITP